MNMISSTVPPADHPASAPPSLAPGKRAQGEGRAPESHSVFSAGKCQSFGTKLGVTRVKDCFFMLWEWGSKCW